MLSFRPQARGGLGGLLLGLLVVVDVLPRAEADYSCTSNEHCRYEGCQERSHSHCAIEGTWVCTWRDGPGNWVACPDPQPCEPGSYSPDGKNGGGDKACQLCPPGTHTWTYMGAPRWGATSCDPCTAAAGTYCPEGSTTDTGVTCPVGFSCAGGAEDKQACPKGWNTITTTGSSECLPPCNAGHSFVNGSCVPCPVGTFLPQTKPTHNQTNLDCTPCPPGSSTDQTAATVPTDCKCKAGFHGPDAGPCFPCPVGFSCMGGEEKVMCPTAPSIGWNYCPKNEQAETNAKLEETNAKLAKMSKTLSMLKSNITEMKQCACASGSPSSPTMSWDYMKSPTWTPSSNDIPAWNQSQYKRCQPVFNSWRDLSRQFQAGSVMVSVVLK